MNKTNPHCFLLDGKTILPIEHHYQLLIALKNRNLIENQSQLSHQDLFNKNCNSLNNNHTNDAVKKKDPCCCLLPFIEKQSNNKRSKLPTTTRSNCQHHLIDRLLNINNETYLITHIIPSIDLTLNSTQDKNNSLPSATTLIIKPFISYENHRRNTSLQKKSSLKRCKSSLSSSSSSKQISHHRMKKHRLSTFKDLTRSISHTKHSHENRSSKIFHPRALLDIYQNKKQAKK